MENPTGEGDLEYIEPILPLSRRPVLILPLHSHEIEYQGENSDNHADRAAPPDNRCADQIILDLVVSPSTHSQAEVEERPISGGGGEDVFLVWVWHQRVV